MIFTQNSLIVKKANKQGFKSSEIQAGGQELGMVIGEWKFFFNNYNLVILRLRKVFEG